MDDGVVKGPTVDQVLLGLPLPDEDVAIPQLIQRMVLVSAPHAGYQDHLLYACLLRSIDLCLLPNPVNLQETNECMEYAFPARWLHAFLEIHVQIYRAAFLQGCHRLVLGRMAKKGYCTKLLGRAVVLVLKIPALGIGPL